MRSRWTAALSAFAMLAFAMFVMAGLAPSVRAADDNTQAQLKAMQDRMQAMEDQLQAANKRVDEQNDVIQRAGLAETRGSSSGLPGFLGSIDIGGWVAASYLYNVNDPNDNKNTCNGGNFPGCSIDPSFEGTGNGLGNTNQGANGKFYPLHPDHNSFSLDQLWFSIERKISEENRAGFKADILYGTTAGLLPGSSFNGNRSNRDSTTSFYVQQAYIQYLAPIGSGITLKAGKFETPIGVEVAETIYNWNITRGALWTLIEPINHVGAQIGGPIGDSGFDWMVGGVNGFNPDSPDRNDGKSVIGHLGWSNKTFTVSTNAIWGPEITGNDGHQSGVANAYVKWNPSERFGMYLNGDYAWINADGGNPSAWGLSLAGRFGITDRTGVALRAEYVVDHNQFFGFQSCGGSLGYTVSGTANCTGDSGVSHTATGVEMYGLTMTLDHLLTDQLMVRGEARYDWLSKDQGKDSEFFQNGRYDIASSKNMPNDQIVVGVELIYNFNKFGAQ